MYILARFKPGDFVLIDGCPVSRGIVTGVMCRGAAFELQYYQVAWVANGNPQEPWIEEFRLSPTEDPKSDRPTFDIPF